MNRQQVIEKLKALEQQTIGLLKKMDETRDHLWHLVRQEYTDRKAVRGLLQSLDTDLVLLQETYQRVIYQTALLIETDGGVKN